MYECQGTLVRQGRGECVLAQWTGWMWVCIFLRRGEGATCEDALWLQSSLLETWILTPLPYCHLSGQNKWGLHLEMTKRCTECTEWAGSGIALQMRWGNVAVVRWAAE